MDIKNRFDAEVEACGDHSMTNEERRAAFAYYVRGVVSEREACKQACEAQRRKEEPDDMTCANDNFNIGVDECVEAISTRSNVKLTGCASSEGVTEK